jgi:hypothetical protein
MKYANATKFHGKPGNPLVLFYLCTARKYFRIRIWHPLRQGGLKPGFSPYSSMSAARLFLELLSTECSPVSVHQLGWMSRPCGYVVGVHGALVLRFFAIAHYACP